MLRRRSARRFRDRRASPFGACESGESVLSGPITLLGNTDIGNQNGNSIGFITGSIGQSGGSWGLTVAPLAGQSRSAILVLGGSNTYTGPTTFAGSTGTLQLANAYAVGPAPFRPARTTAACSSPRASSRSTSAGCRAPAVLSYLTPAAARSLLVGGNSQSSTYAGELGGLGGLVKTGTGILTVGGSNSFGGGTTVNNGTLQLGNVAALGTGGLAANGGTLDLAGSSVTVPSFSGDRGSGDRHVEQHIGHGDAVYGEPNRPPLPSAARSRRAPTAAWFPCTNRVPGSLTLSGTNTLGSANVQNAAGACNQRQHDGERRQRHVRRADRRQRLDRAGRRRPRLRQHGCQRFLRQYHRAQRRRPGSR